jgi:hypothetical protein
MHVFHQLVSRAKPLILSATILPDDGRKSPSWCFSAISTVSPKSDRLPLMKTCCILAILGICTLSAQNPILSGVWKANLEKSKLNGPQPSLYLMILEQQDSKLSEKLAVQGNHGEQRSSFTFNTEGKPSINAFRGLPMRTTAAWNAGILVLDSKIAGPHPATVNEKYTLSADGNTLTLDSVTIANGEDTRQSVVFEKQPDSAGEPLRKPEEAASVRFKNVQVMKETPASQFIDAMRSFSMSLGSDCEFCHVQGKFESDDKPAKAMARKMIAMTRTINEQNFGGRSEVRCYTCHQGKPEPQSRPSF